MRSSSEALAAYVENKSELSLEETSDLEDLVVDNNESDTDASRAAAATTTAQYPVSIASSRSAFVTSSAFLMRS